jgi:hypothetical protein
VQGELLALGPGAAFDLHVGTAGLPRGGIEFRAEDADRVGMQQRTTGASGAADEELQRLLCVGEPALRASSETAIQELAQRCGEVLGPDAGGFEERLAREHPQEARERRRRLLWPEQEHEHGAEGEQIAAGVDGAAEQDLGRGEEPRAAGAAVAAAHRKTEVQQVDSRGFVQQDVGGLQVQVQDPAQVDVGQHLQRLSGDGQRLLGRRAAWAVERVALDVLPQQEDPAVVGAPDLVESGDSRVPQREQYRGFGGRCIGIEHLGDVQAAVCLVAQQCSLPLAALKDLQDIEAVGELP